MGARRDAGVEGEPLLTCATAGGTWQFVTRRVMDAFLRAARVCGVAADDAAGPQVRPADDPDLGFDASPVAP